MISVHQVLDTQIQDAVNDVINFNQQSARYVETVFSCDYAHNAQSLEKASFGLKALCEVTKQKIITVETLWDSCLGRGFVSGKEEIGLKLQKSKLAFDIAFKNFFVADKQFRGYIGG